MLFPSKQAKALKEAVIVTTSGGIVGGDRLRFAVDGGTATSATVTTQAAEKVYRSAGRESDIGISITVRDDALIEWMPQETILFEGARLRRRTGIDLSGNGRIIAGEIVVFGRRARDEKFTEGLLHDAWRIRRDGSLIWADGLHLEDDIGAEISDRHAFDSAAAIATVVYCAADAPERLGFARSNVRSGAATCVDDVLIARFIGRDAAALRADVAAYWGFLRSEVAGLPTVLPRVWEI
ncbi:MAG: urease accessory protein UreD [Alphaproteobacteria bacterium]